MGVLPAQVHGAAGGVFHGKEAWLSWYVPQGLVHASLLWFGSCLSWFSPCDVRFMHRVCALWLIHEGSCFVLKVCLSLKVDFSCVALRCLQYCTLCTVSAMKLQLTPAKGTRDSSRMVTPCLLRACLQRSLAVVPGISSHLVISLQAGGGQRQAGPLSQIAKLGLLDRSRLGPIGCNT